MPRRRTCGARPTCRRKSASPRSASRRTCVARIATLQDLGLGYLALERSTPTLSPGELQRLRLATQIRSNLFGVVYVLDEPSAGPASGRRRGACCARWSSSRRTGNSLFVVEHDLDVMRRADWIVDVGPDAGERGGRVLYSGPPAGLRGVAASQHRALPVRRPCRRATRRRARRRAGSSSRASRATTCASSTSRFPLGVFTAVTGVSGSGKSSLVSQALVELVCAHLGHEPDASRRTTATSGAPELVLHHAGPASHAALEAIRRLVRVDQKPIGRTPRSNLATYTGLFDHVRKLFAATPAARAASLRRRPLLVQRREGPLRDLRRRRFRQRRAAVHAQRVRALPDVPRRALQRRRRSRSPGAASTSPTCWR